MKVYDGTAMDWPDKDPAIKESVYSEWDMKVALLCPGPGLHLFPGKEEGGFDWVVAINTAWEGYHGECDDIIYLDKVKPHHRAMINKLKPRGRWLGKHELASVPGMPARREWSRYTVCGAMMWIAACNRETHPKKLVYIYGADMAGDHGWDETKGRNRNPRRWQNERQKIVQMMKHNPQWLNGCQFVRVLCFDMGGTQVVQY